MECAVPAEITELSNGAEFNKKSHLIFIAARTAEQSRLIRVRQGRQPARSLRRRRHRPLVVDLESVSCGSPLSDYFGVSLTQPDARARIPTRPHHRAAFMRGGFLTESPRPRPRTHRHRPGRQVSQMHGLPRSLRDDAGTLRNPRKFGGVILAGCASPIRPPQSPA